MQFVDLLLSHGADIESRDKEGRTALHRAAEEGHSGDIVKVLLENGLDISAGDHDGRTALMTALRCCTRWKRQEYKSLVTQLLECGASVNRSDFGGWTALNRAATYGVIKIASRLLEVGVDANARTMLERQPRTI